MIYPPQYIRQIDDYIRLLLKWNATYRLVGESSPHEVWDKHIVDAIVLAHQLHGCRSIVDLGSGPGLPGIPLKVLLPETELILVESQRKRVNFCDNVIRQLSLRNVQIIHGRAEDPSVYNATGKSDVVVSRATWRLSEFYKIARPYLSENGRCVALKGKNWASEFAEAKESLPPISQSISVPYSTILSRTERYIVIVS